MGAGIIGLLTLAALRATDSQATIWVVARYPFQADAARKLGADFFLTHFIFHRSPSFAFR